MIKERTSTLVTHWSVSKVAALGNGDGYLRFDACLLGCFGKHNCTQTTWLTAQFLHLGAALVRNRGRLVFSRFGAWSQPQRSSFHWGLPAFAITIDIGIRKSEYDNTEKKGE
eukprot:Gb_14432 [translate_table: standard]